MDETISVYRSNFELRESGITATTQLPILVLSGSGIWNPRLSPFPVCQKFWSLLSDTHVCGYIMITVLLRLVPGEVKFTSNVKRNGGLGESAMLGSFQFYTQLCVCIQKYWSFVRANHRAGCVICSLCFPCFHVSIEFSKNSNEFWFSRFICLKEQPIFQRYW